MWERYKRNREKTTVNAVEGIELTAVFKVQIHFYFARK